MFFILLVVHATLGAFARLIPTLVRVHAIVTPPITADEVWLIPTLVRVHGAHIGKIVL